MGATKVRQVVADPDFATLPRDVQDRLLVEAEAVQEESSAPAEAAPKSEETGILSGSKGHLGNLIMDVATGQNEEVKQFGRGAVRGAKQGLLDMIDPRTYWNLATTVAGVPEQAIRSAGRALLDPEAEATAIADKAGAIKDALKAMGESASTPEGAGEAIGGLLPSALPVGGIVAKVGKKAGELARESRFHNVIRAVGETNAAKKQEIERLVNAGELELPVSMTAKSLRKKMGAKEAENMVELRAAKAEQAALPGDVDVQPTIDALKAQRPVFEGAPSTVVTQPRTPAGLTAQRPAPVVTRVPAPEGAGNRALRDAIDKQIDELVRVAGPDAKLKAGELQKLKEQAQSAATGAFKVASGTGAEAAAGAEAAQLARKAVQDTLENSPDIPDAIRTRLTAANKREHALLAATQPLEAQRMAKAGGNVISRSIGGLLGRFFGGGGTSALGAVGGVEASAQFQNVLFNTLTAAGKAKVAPFLEAGDYQGAVQAAFAAHIANNAAQRAQQEPQP